MKLLNICNKVIEYSFYLLFFLVPLAFTSDTSELFEFNKLWVGFILSLVIGFFWITKMIVKKEFRIQRTPLDIPIGLFLVSQIISTIVSMDSHVSLWGYYSRFNGGLLSILSYFFLYYAYVTNLRDEKKEEQKPFEFKKVYIFLSGVVVFIIGTLIASQIKVTTEAGIPFQMIATLLTCVSSFAVLMKAAPVGIVKRSLYAIFSSAILVVLWGLPSHFGFDPTCLLFRGTLDVSCWTSDFQPKIRIFSTMGQPDWLAAYLSVLLPILTGLFLNFTRGKAFFENKLASLKNRDTLVFLGYLFLFIAFYLALLYTRSRSAILSFWLILPMLLGIYFWFYLKPTLKKRQWNFDLKLSVSLLVLTGVITFFVGQPFNQLTRFTLEGIKPLLTAKESAPQEAAKAVPTPTPAPPPASELGGTDSGVIRLLVWRGALDIWKNNPVFGSGVETFAFAYYKYRPAAHNMTSEAKFLYNKAHNEYLNYLATTGTVGIATYLLMIGGFLFISVKNLWKRRTKPSPQDFLVVSILGGYIAILITNFFGFSVVMINILFYAIPAFVFMLLGIINYDKAYAFVFSKRENYYLTSPQKALIGVIGIVFLYLLYSLINFWNADRYYYFGKNYDAAGDYQKAYTFLKMATDKRPSEPVFRDEYAYNNAVLASAIISQAQEQTDKAAKDQSLQIAKQLIDSAISNTNKITTDDPENIVFWKSKVRVFYTLAQVDSSYYPMALAAIKKTAELAPTDADVSYNLGVLQGQTGDSKGAVETLERTIKLKPDYYNAYYALGIFYHQLALDAKGNVVNKEFNQKAIDQMKYIIKNFGANPQAEDAIKAWGGTP